MRQSPDRKTRRREAALKRTARKEKLVRLLAALVPAGAAVFLLSPEAGADPPTPASPAAPTPDARADPPTFTIKPPAGFEVDDGEQTTIVDVIVDDRKRGETPARFDADKITFLDPEGLANILPSVRDFEIVARALAVPQSTNRARSCNAPNPLADCGYVEPDPVAVIFSPDRLQARIFVSELHTYRRDQAARYLPPPTFAPGLIFGVDARAFHSLDNDSTSASAGLQFVTGAGRNAVHADGFANFGSTTTLRSLYFQRTERTRELSLGYLQQESGSSFARTARLAGVRYGSTLKARTDTERLGASDLPVSLTSDATVEIRRDDDLLDVQRVTAGQSRLSTSRLPQGSYIVTLRITENGETREETRFFTTGGRLPPANAPQWSIEAGLQTLDGSRATLLPDFGDDFVIRMQGSKRIGTGIGLSADAHASVRDQFVEIAAFTLGPHHTSEVGVVASVDGDVGGYANVSYTIGGFSTSASYRDLRAKDETRFTANAPFDPFPNSLRQANANLSYRFKRGQIGLRGFYSQTSNREGTWFAGPTLDYTLATLGPTRLDLNAQLERGDSRSSAFVGLRLNTRFATGKSGRSTSLSSQASVRRTEPTGVGPTTRQDVIDAVLRTTSPRRADLQADYTFGVRYEDREVGFQAGVRSEFPFANTEIDVRQNYQNQSTVLANVSSAIAFGRGGTALSSRFQDAGVIVSLKGAGHDRFDILEDGSARRRLQPGSSGFQPLQSYNVHDIAIRAGTASNVEYDGRADRVVIFPGNVPTVSRSAYTVRIVVGRLLDTGGAPMADAPIRTTRLLAVSDANGYFQLDLAGDETAVAGAQAGPQCRLDFRRVGAADPAATFVNAGDIVCRPNFAPQ